MWQASSRCWPLRHEALPASLHSQPRNPHIPWDSLPVEVVAVGVPWPRGERVRRAGVSSFGHERYQCPRDRRGSPSCGHRTHPAGGSERTGASGAVRHRAARIAGASGPLGDLAAQPSRAVAAGPGTYRGTTSHPLRSSCGARGLGPDLRRGGAQRAGGGAGLSGCVRREGATQRQARLAVHWPR